ncbi:MAG: tetratricopeptide repeat protein [Prevotella sp.]
MSNKENYFEESEFKENLNRFENAQDSGESIFLDSDTYADIAEYYLHLGQTQKASQVIEQGLASFPNSTSLWISKARIVLTTEHNIQQAYHCLNQVEDTSNLEYTYMLAEIMLEDDQIVEAKELLNHKFEELETEDQQDFLFDTASLFADYEMFDEAKTWFDQIEISDESEYKELKARILSGAGDYNESEKLLEELIDEDPFSTEYWNNLAALQLSKNEFNKSISSSEYSMAINPNDEEAVLNKGNGLFCLGNYQEALRYYKLFSKLSPNDASGEMLQGTALIHLNRPEEALDLLKKAEQKSKDYPANLSEIYQEIAFTLSRLGHLDQALDYVLKKGQLPNDNMCDTLLLKGHILLENDQLEQAETSFQEAVRQSNNSPDTFLQIAISVYDCGYLEQAYKLFKAFFSSCDEKNIDGYSYMAICCKELGKSDEYLENAKKACNLNPIEAKMVMGSLFPPDLNPDNYYEYLKEQSSKQK